MCRFTNSPTNGHWVAAKPVLQYLSGTKDQGIIIGRTKRHIEGDGLVGYSDADWAGDTSDRKSTTGYALFLKGGIVNWNSFKQKSTALSSTEAEYISIADCVKSVMSIRRVLKELGSWCMKKPTKIFEDNQSCIAWVPNPGKRGKHVEVRYHYSRETAEEGNIEPIFCCTSDCIALCTARGVKNHRQSEELQARGLAQKSRAQRINIHGSDLELPTWLSFMSVG